jgi:hypothetical protein
MRAHGLHGLPGAQHVLALEQAGDAGTRAVPVSGGERRAVAGFGAGLRLASCAIF